MRVRGGVDPIEKLVESIHPDAQASKLYPFRVRVACIKRRPPRHEFFEHFIDMGRGDIDRVFERTPFRNESLTFVFPERWMGIAEQRAFMKRLSVHPDALSGKIKDMVLVTSSPIIIGDFMNTQIAIISWPDDEKYGWGIGA